MKSLIKNLNLSKDSKKAVLGLLAAVDKDVKMTFRDNEYINSRFAGDYRMAVKNTSIISYITICSRIIRSMPKDGILRSRMYSDLLALTESVYKSTGNPRFKSLQENLREMMKKKITVDPGRIQIEIKAGTLLKDRGNTAELMIKNRNPVKIEVSIDEISSENAKISISGPKELALPPGSKGGVKLFIEPAISGKIILKSSLNIKYEEWEKALENYFELPVSEEMAQAQTVVAPQGQQTQKLVVSANQSAESTVSMDIERLIKRAKPEEWIKVIEDCVENEEKIQLDRYSRGALAMYQERGYTGLLLSAFIVDQAQLRKKDVLRVFSGDAFTYRNIELFMDISKKKELRFEAGSSDAGYIQEGLNIITGDFELPSKEKKKKKRWEISLPESRKAVITKKIIKDDSGRAKKIIFRLSEQ